LFPAVTRRRFDSAPPRAAQTAFAGSRFVYEYGFRGSNIRLPPLFLMNTDSKALKYPLAVPVPFDIPPLCASAPLSRLRARRGRNFLDLRKSLLNPGGSAYANTPWQAESRGGLARFRRCQSACGRRRRSCGAFREFFAAAALVLAVRRFISRNFGVLRPFRFTPLRVYFKRKRGPSCSISP
jgi:hypothetical protein